MNKAHVYFIRQDRLQAPDAAVIRQWLQALPAAKQQAVSRLLKPADRLASLLGLRLLDTLARDLGLECFHLRDIVYPQSGKPHWRQAGGTGFDFNISHSSGLVVVVASLGLHLGVDVEKIRPLKSMNFKRVMTAAELERMVDDPPAFFTRWAQKEAVVKAADTTGIERMRDVVIDGGQARLDGRGWYLTGLAAHLAVARQFSAWLASSQAVDELVVREVDFEELVTG